MAVDMTKTGNTAALQPLTAGSEVRIPLKRYAIYIIENLGRDSAGVARPTARIFFSTNDEPVAADFTEGEFKGVLLEAWYDAVDYLKGGASGTWAPIAGTAFLRVKAMVANTVLRISELTLTPGFLGPPWWRLVASPAE